MIQEKSNKVKLVASVETATADPVLNGSSFRRLASRHLSSVQQFSSLTDSPFSTIHTLIPSDT